MKATLSLMLGAAILVATPSFAAESPGLVPGTDLKSLTAPLWHGMKAADVKAALNALPDDTGSRAMNQLVKAAILAPITLPDAAPAKASKNTDSEDDTAEAPKMDKDAEEVTAIRLKKLLEMGGLNEAKMLVDVIDTDTIATPELKEQVLLALVASNTKQAACIDLLAYRDDAPEDFAKLPDGARTVLEDCLKPATAPDAPHTKKNYSFDELKALGPWESALAITDDAASISASGNVVADFNALSPFQQALVIGSPAMSPRLQWRLIGQALRHDFITARQAGDIYNRAEAAVASTNPTELRRAVSAKPGFERLPYYYKALSSDKSGGGDLIKALATPVGAAGVTSDIYALIPFTPYLPQLDMSTLAARSAFINTLPVYMNGGSLADINQKPAPKDAAWIFTVLEGEQAPAATDIDMWAEKNKSLLAGIAPQLEDRLAQRLHAMMEKNENKSTWLKDYVNKKSLTESRNYVMHDEQALSEAESLGSEGAVGKMLVQLALAGKKSSPDRLDPEGMMRMTSLLEKTGLTQTAHKLIAEELVFHMAPSASSMGNNTKTGE